MLPPDEADPLTSTSSSVSIRSMLRQKVRSDGPKCGIQLRDEHGAVTGDVRRPLIDLTVATSPESPLEPMPNR